MLSGIEYIFYLVTSLAIIVGIIVMMFYFVLGSVKSTRKSKTGLKLFCSCGNDLVQNGFFISDDLDGVKYKCSVCSEISFWNFDLAPVPIKIKNGIPAPKDM